MTKVVVLGAGASCSYKESPTGQHPPLAKEIIPTFHKLDIAENRYVIIGDIINYIRDTRGIDPITFSTWDEDIESVFTEIDEKIQMLVLQLRQSERNTEIFGRIVQTTRAYSQLIFLFASIMNEIQNGPVSIPYALLADELNSYDTIITFNWDTLMDRALMCTNRWFPNDGYYIKPEYIFNDGWHKPDEFDYLKGSPQYLKLHGSTNWLIPIHGVNLTTGQPYTLNGYAMNKLFVFFKATHSYETYEDRYWGPYQPFSYCYYPPNLPLSIDTIRKGYKLIRAVSAIDLPEHGKVVVDENKVYSMPLIVPPVRNKQYARYGKIFSELWEHAENAISQCKHLYLIGYSFPETDVVAKNMFKKAISKNQKLEKIIIINPNPERINTILTKDFAVNVSKVIVRSKRYDGKIFEHT